MLVYYRLYSSQNCGPYVILTDMWENLLFLFFYKIIIFILTNVVYKLFTVVF